MRPENCSINWGKVVAQITVHFAFGSFLLSQQILLLCGCDMSISWKKCQILTNVYSPLGTLGNTNKPSTPDLTRHKGVSMSVFFLMFSITSPGISSQPGKFFELTKSETRSLIDIPYMLWLNNSWFQWFPLCLGKEMNDDEIDTKLNLNKGQNWTTTNKNTHATAVNNIHNNVIHGVVTIFFKLSSSVYLVQVALINTVMISDRNTPQHVTTKEILLFLLQKPKAEKCYPPKVRIRPTKPSSFLNADIIIHSNLYICKSFAI